jgi:glycosyltransferase involved in cell wall biosynthesis
VVQDSLTMSNNKLLSVIVPAYNTEKYIYRCLISLCSQTLDTALYEVIVVNDGSQDELEKAVLDLQSKYPQIEYIVQDNKNQGGARNTGIRAARGKYIIFVDSDDYIRYKNALEILIRIAKLNNAEVLWSEKYIATAYQDHFDLETYTKDVDLQICSGKEIIKGYNFPYAAWQFVISKEYLNKYRLFFREGVYYEDSDFTAKLFYYAGRVAITDFQYYVYCNNESSITSTPSLKAFTDNCKSLIALKSFIDKYVVEPELQFRLREKIKKALLSYLKISRKYAVGDSLKALSVIRNHDVMRLSDYSCSKYELLQLAAMKYSPFLAFHSVQKASRAARFVKCNSNKLKRVFVNEN